MCPASSRRCPACATRSRRCVADGDRVVVAYTLHAQVNDRDVAVRGVMRFRVEDGLIAHRTDYWDSLVFQQQAGLA